MATASVILGLISMAWLFLYLYLLGRDFDGIFSVYGVYGYFLIAVPFAVIGLLLRISSFRKKKTSGRLIAASGTAINVLAILPLVLYGLLLFVVSQAHWG
jgi:hypothetical protein